MLNLLLLGDLPSHLFSGSGDNKSKKRERKTKNKTSSQDDLEKSISSKNLTIEFCVLSETCSNISQHLSVLNDKKRKLKGMFIKEVCDGNKKHAKERMKLHFSN